MNKLSNFIILLCIASFTIQLSDGVNFDIKPSLCDLPNPEIYKATISITNFFKLQYHDELSSDLSFKVPCVDYNTNTLKIRMMSQEYTIIIGNEELVYEGDSEEFEDIPINDIPAWWRANIGYYPEVVLSGEIVSGGEGDDWVEFTTVPRDFLAQMEDLELTFSPEETTYYVMTEEEEVIPFKHSESPEDFNVAQLFIHGTSEMI